MMIINMNLAQETDTDTFKRGSESLNFLCNSAHPNETAERPRAFLHHYLLLLHASLSKSGDVWYTSYYWGGSP